MRKDRRIFFFFLQHYIAKICTPGIDTSLRGCLRYVSARLVVPMSRMSGGGRESGVMARDS
jgi:hypothetical protein